MKPLKQGTPEWLEIRAMKISGSRVSAILGHNPYDSPEDIMDEFLREYAGMKKKFTGNHATEWGTEHEPIARAAYEKETGNLVEEFAWVPHPVHEFIGVSPDGFADEGGVEFKCPYSQKIPDEPPAHYVDQCQLFMECADLPWVDLFYWTPAETKLFHVERDPAWWDNAFPKIQAFWERFLELRESYEPPEDKPEMLIVNGLEEVADELKEIQIDMLALKKREADLKEVLKAHVDDLADTDFGSIVAIHSTRKGALDQKALGADIDLSKYRKEDTTIITFKRK